MYVHINMYKYICVIRSWGREIIRPPMDFSQRHSIA